MSGYQFYMRENRFPSCALLGCLTLCPVSLSLFLFPRDRIKAENPDLNFGAISGKVGEQWRGLSVEKKMPYMQSAAKVWTLSAG